GRTAWRSARARGARRWDGARLDLAWAISVRHPAANPLARSVDASGEISCPGAGRYADPCGRAADSVPQLRSGALQELGPERLAPVRDDRDLLLLQQALGRLLEVRAQVGREAGLHLDAGQRPGEGLPAHLVTLPRVEGVDDVGHLGRVLL